MRGIPTAMVATHPFRKMAETEVRVLGLKDLPITFIPHPVGGLKPDLVVRKAEAAVTDVVAALTQPRSAGT
ncbi:MAG TPA: hypothetical protein VHL09_16900 [Dehalococcoidia bacterium]|nr:hypothetical protein [Dehalococcoidia bacterium]